MIFRKLEFISHQKGEKKQSRTHEKKNSYSKMWNLHFVIFKSGFWSMVVDFKIEKKNSDSEIVAFTTEPKCLSHDEIIPVCCGLWTGQSGSGMSPLCPWSITIRKCEMLSVNMVIPSDLSIKNPLIQLNRLHFYLVIRHPLVYPAFPNRRWQSRRADMWEKGHQLHSRGGG